MSIETELTEITKVTRKADEAQGAYLYRLFTKVNALSDEDWEKLSEDAQKWANAASDAQAQNPENPAIPNFDGTVVEGAAPEKAKKPAKKKAEPKAPKEAKEKEAKAEAKPAKTKKAPPAAEKETKPAKPAKAAKKAASKSNGAKGPGRPTAFTPEAKITVVAKENPFREGSNSHKVFGMYKKGMTVADFEKAVSKGSWKSTPKMFLMVHANRGLIKVG